MAAPASWNPGDEVIVSPALITGRAREVFGEVEVVLPYLRKIKQPR